MALLGMAFSAMAGPVPQVRYTVSPLNGESVLDSTLLRQHVEFLCNPETGGRATGTPGAQSGWKTSSGSANWNPSPAPSSTVSAPPKVLSAVT